MNMRKALIFLILTGLTLFILPAGKTDGADFTQQREGAFRTAQEPPAAAVGVQAETNQPRLMSQVRKSKAEGDPEPAAGGLPEKRAKYRPYIAGEGDKKTR